MIAAPALRCFRRDADKNGARAGDLERDGAGAALAGAGADTAAAIELTSLALAPASN